MLRAYSVLAIKSIDEAQRIIEGIATTPNPDRMGDVVEPLGGTFALPLPFMWQHGRDPFVGQTPVGNLIAATPTKDGIPVRIQLERTNEPGRLKDILDFAWQAVQKRLVRGLSIGFDPKEYSFIEDTGGLHFTKWDWLELSGVTIPANADASITAIKSAVASLRTPAPISTATGDRDRRVVLVSPGATGRSGPRVAMKTYDERIKSLAAERAAKVARQNELMKADDGSTLDAAGQEEFDNLQKDIVGIDGELGRLTVLQENNKALAKPVAGATPEEGLATRGNLALAPVVTVTPNREKGIGFARIVMCRMASFLSRGEKSASAIAKERYPDDLAVQLYLKAAVGSGTTTDPTNASPLAYLRDLPSEFIEFLRPMTIIGRLPGLRMVPFNVRMVSQTTGGVANWVGQAKPKNLTKFDFAPVSLGIAKIAAIAVIADELAMLSAPSAETIVRDSLAGAVVQKMDHDFIDPALAILANVHPASITNGVTPLTSSGSTADNVRSDLVALMSKFVIANQDPSKAAWIMPNTLCLALATMVNALGQREFPGMTIQGGELAGLPVVGTQQASLGGTVGDVVILVNPPEIFVADDGSVAIDVSREAALEMSDAPTQDGAAGTGAAMVSLWQDNLLGIRAERHINWTKRRPEAVEFMQTVVWGGASTLESDRGRDRNDRGGHEHGRAAAAAAAKRE